MLQVGSGSLRVWSKAGIRASRRKDQAIVTKAHGKFCVEDFRH